jgi:hypothetical protein
METYSGNVETTGVEQGDDFTFAQRVGLSIILAVGVVGLWWSFHEPTPRYHAGACIQLKQSEPWEALHRVEMVGKRSYLVRRIPETLVHTTLGGTLYFSDAHSDYEEVPCPQPTKGAK